MNKRKERGRLVQEAIRKILFEFWDPLGINKFGLEDEYDRYIGDIYRLLSSNCTLEDLLNYLYMVEVEKLGFPEHDKNLNIEFANKLFALNTKL